MSEPTTLSSEQERTNIADLLSQIISRVGLEYGDTARVVITPSLMNITSYDRDENGSFVVDPTTGKAVMTTRSFVVET